MKKSESDSLYNPVFEKTDFLQTYFIPNLFKKKTKLVLSAICLLLVFGAFNSYSTRDCSKRYFIKPKKVKLLPPEEISLMSREEVYVYLGGNTWTVPPDNLIF